MKTNETMQTSQNARTAQATQNAQNAQNAQRGGPLAAEDLNQRPTETPAVDIYESKDELLVVADLPGVTTETVSIHFEKNKLTLEGRPTEATSAAGPHAQKPFEYRRTFIVPQGIDAEAISAQMKCGVLRVHLPKAAPFKPRQIQVKAG